MNEKIKWFKFSFHDRVIPKKNSYQIKKSTSTGKFFIGPKVDQKKCAKKIADVARSSVIYSSFEIKQGIRQAFPTRDMALSGLLLCEINYSGKADLDNMSTTILDALQQSGKIENDRKIDELHIRRIKIEPKASYKYLTEITVSTLRRET